MKKVILVIDEDPIYSKRFCNQAIKIMGKEFLFLSFANMNLLKEYLSENAVEGVVISEVYEKEIDELKVNSFYILNEKNKTFHKEGKRNYIYRLQNISKILEFIETDLSKVNDEIRINENSSKVILFYTPESIKHRMEIVKKIASMVSNDKKILIVDLDEFDNYKGSVGLSGLIFNYKENNLSVENIKKEIVMEKEQEFIRSVTYPEDFSIVNSIDLENIVNELRNVGYDYIFINADASYNKIQYILNDADKIILIKDVETEKLDKFKSFIKLENQVEYKKITEFDVTKIDKAYGINFVKGCFDDE